MALTTTGIGDGGGENTWVVYILFPPPDHSRTEYCNKTHYGNFPGGGAETGVNSVEAVVGAGGLGPVGDVGGGLDRLIVIGGEGGRGGSGGRQINKVGGCFSMLIP